MDLRPPFFKGAGDPYTCIGNNELHTLGIFMKSRDLHQPSYRGFGVE
jgi:hypothetical protein